MIGTENVESLNGATVYGTDGDKIGTVGQVYVDATDGHPSWVTVKTGLFGTSESFVPLDAATAEGDTIRVGFDKHMVKDAPRIDTDGALSPEEEDQLYRYYGIGAGETTTHSGTNDYAAGTDYTGTEFAGRTDTTSSAGTVGYDTSGPTTDSAMTRSEEHLNVGTERVQTGRARLRKYVVTENQTVTVPVEREEVRLEREPITDANIGDALDGPAISEEEHEVILSEERPVVTKEATPVERVRLDKEVVTENQAVSGEVRKEQIELEDDGTTNTTRRTDRI
ncbi:PRC and DUF2382 domain-containing protein [Naasia aerilata]|uniref:Photosystem reaction center subunit H n=1 Tax=Naasia aerilata TaxID=1162966 RepID=A0ABN6XNY0_9MICO|nr:PRC and DUF2382 domain-containing protein [Naasia aerilata]BDZ46705.1 hypothetical protein GCM10025866_26140 [Naasia aerilata]